MLPMLETMDVWGHLPLEPIVHTAFLVSSILCIYFFIYPLYFGPFSHIPGPRLGKISWYYIAWYDLQLRRNEKIAKWHQEYGPIVCFRPGEVSISDPVVVREVYGTAGKYTKSDLFDSFMVYGERPIFATGPHWEHRKKRMSVSSFYHKTTISRPIIESFMRENARKVVGQIEKQIREDPGNQAGPATITIDAYPLFNCFAFDNITRLLFGSEYGSKTIENDCREREILVGLKQAQMWGPLKYNFSWIVSFAATLLSILPKSASDLLIPKTLQLCLTSEDELADWNWKTAQAATDNSATLEDYTLLNRLLALKEKEDSGFTFNYVAAEMFDNILAAEETVAVGLVYLSYHLAWYPEWQRRIRDGLRRLPLSSDGYPRFTDIDSFALLEAFMREVSRVNPGAGGRNERYVKEGGQTFKGTYLPQGARLTASTISVHLNEEVFDAPDQFIPERWIDRDAETMRRMEHSFIPFGCGARICLGKALGLMELKVMIAHLLLRFKFEPVREMGNGKTGPLWQSGTIEAVPIGLRCDIVYKTLENAN
jgi:cytochrome P450